MSGLKVEMQRYDCKLLMKVRFMGHILWCNIYKIDIQGG